VIDSVIRPSRGSARNGISFAKHNNDTERKTVTYSQRRAQDRQVLSALLDGDMQLGTAASFWRCYTDEAAARLCGFLRKGIEVRLVRKDPSNQAPSTRDVYRISRGWVQAERITGTD
jgi:hypothetical protein